MQISNVCACLLRVPLPPDAMSLRSNLLSLLQVNAPAIRQRCDGGGAAADTFVSSGRM
jgi:hypothetical protein